MFRFEFEGEGEGWSLRRLISGIENEKGEKEGRFWQKKNLLSLQYTSERK